MPVTPVKPPFPPARIPKEKPRPKPKVPAPKKHSITGLTADELAILTTVMGSVVDDKKTPAYKLYLKVYMALKRAKGK